VVSHRSSHHPPARREWLCSLAGCTDDILAAARACMRQLDDCEPDDCEHPEQMMTPLEFAQWLEREVHRVATAPIRLDHHETRRAGQFTRHAT
jgi:hypothetical protein